MRSLAIALILLLAGCAGPVTETPTEEAHETATAPETPAAEAPRPAADPGAQEAPWDLLVQVSDVNGTSPLNVTFQMSSSRALQNVSWSIDFGDGNATTGDGLPATATHAFLAGNHSVAIIARTALREDIQHIDINVTEPPAPPAPVITPFQADIAVGVPYQSGPQLLSQAEFVWTSYEDGAPWVKSFDLTVPIGTLSLAITTEALAATGDLTHPTGDLCPAGSPVAPDIDLFLFEEDGTLVASSGNCGTGEEIAIDAPAFGEYIAVVWGFLGADMKVPGEIALQPPQES